MITLDLNWKTFNISLPKLREWIDANIATPCVGISANSKLQIHFEQEPEELDKNALLSYYEALDEESIEATSYLTKEQELAAQQAELQAKKDSAKAKLLTLGLTEDEIAAILR
jgi:hypothetical protein